MNILAMDLGKSKTVVCFYDSNNSNYKFDRVKTTPEKIHNLLVEYSPDRIVFEVSSVAGWVYDICSTLKINAQVANPNTQAWRWKNVKSKNDKKDALKLAQLSAMNQLPTVHMPKPAVRQERAMIHYRHTLVGSYVGLTPRQYQSGSMDRQGKISGQGNKLLRALLVEISWLGLRHNSWLRRTYQRLLRGSPSRKKIAITAVARKLLVRCWAMLRDGQPWREMEIEKVKEAA